MLLLSLIHILHDGVERYFAYPYANKELATMRNVAGEIKGSEGAMCFAKENGYKKLAIQYEYEGIQKWCTGEWAAKKEGTQAYQRIYEEMKQYVQIKLVKVKGHSNDKYNDYADMLDVYKRQGHDLVITEVSKKEKKNYAPEL